jgi:site-specific DNA-methyltransferase (adenine-specific)
MWKCRFHRGDALKVLMRKISSESIDCCITSPPYWGLRDYGVGGQIGLENSISEWRDRLIAIFAEVKRVLKPEGTFWLNIGDSYSGKSLIGQPWLLAFALRDAGWYLRSEIIWHKRNPMPESIRDRPTKSHEQLFLLSKNAKYFYDQEAIREPHTYDGRKKTTVKGKEGSIQHRDGERWPNSGKNKRDVWVIPTQPFPEAHFATFPEKLVEPCIMAGTSQEGYCRCGKPWVRVVEIPRNVKDISPLTYTIGWEPSCKCDTPDKLPGIILDPFMGSGTVAVVSRRLRRDFVGIELNSEYVEIAKRRLDKDKNKKRIKL